ncbi:MAG: glycosyltransferase [bacterium]
MVKFCPLISICIFTYNRANYIKETIESVLEQSYDNYEIVIVNDGSTDETEDVIKSIITKKIRYFKKEHTNAPDTRNRALKEAKGDYILWLGDDDLLHKDILQIYVDTLIKFPDVDICYCNLLAFNEHKGILRQFVYRDWYNDQANLQAFLLIGQPIPDGSTIINRRVYDVIGEFNIEFNRAQDYEFYTRVVLSGKFQFKYVDEFLVKYRIHEKNITLNLSGQINYCYEAKILKSLLEKNPLQIFFPSLDWESDTKHSLSEAYYGIGIKYFNYAAYPESLFYLISSLRFNPLLDRLKHIIESFIQFGLIKEIKILLYFTKDLFNEAEELDEIIKLLENYNIEK